MKTITAMTMTLVAIAVFVVAPQAQQQNAAAVTNAPGIPGSFAHAARAMVRHRAVSPAG